MAGGDRDERVAGVERRHAEPGHGAYGVHGEAAAHRQVRHDDHRGRLHLLHGGEQGRDGRPGAEHAAPSAAVDEERAQRLHPQGMGVVRAARQDDGRESLRLRREGRDLSQPRAHGFGREVLMADAAPPGLPPPPDPPHGRHHDLVDRRAQAELVGGVVQARSDPSGLHRLRGVEEGVDEAASRLSRLQQEPRAGCGVRGPLASGDLVAHEPELVDRHHGVPAVAAARARGRREVVAPLPRPQRGHRDRQQAARLLDGHETAARTRRHRVLGDHGRSSGAVPADALHRDSWCSAAADRARVTRAALRRFRPCAAPRLRGVLRSQSAPTATPGGTSN